MEQSLDYRFPLKRRQSWIREVPIVVTDGPKVAFVLFLGFIILLYSNVAIIYKQQLQALRPTLLVAVAALAMMVIETARSGRGLRLSRPQGVLLLAFLMVCAISTTTSIYVTHAADQTIEFGKIVLVYLLIENVVTSVSRLRKVMFTMVLGGLFPALGTISHYHAGILVEKSRAAWRGIFGNPNEVSYALIVLIPLALVLARTSRRPIQIALWAVIGIYLVAIFFTFSRGGFLTLAAVVGYLAWKHNSLVIKAAMVAAILAGIVIVGMFWKRSSGDFKGFDRDTSFQERLYTFEAGIQMFLHHPVLGVGPGDSMVAYPLYAPITAKCGCHDQLIIHNSYLQALGELGLLGFTFFMSFIGIPAYQAWKLDSGPLGLYMIAFGAAMCGFLVFSLSGGFVYTWWPYILVGLITAARLISDSTVPENSSRGMHGV